MDLERMLQKCHKGQWHIDQIDWSIPPRPLSPAEERTVVQYFLNMSGIERLAKALFEEQRRRTDDPLLQEIFTTFIEDEERHAQVAERLADYYNVNRYQDYAMDSALVEFRPVFLDAVREVSAEMATIYITTGELLLDTALLRSLADYVDDEVCGRVMKLINRDESRHIAIDYYMVGLYASDEYQAWLRAQPRKPLAHWGRALFRFIKVLYYAGPFIRRIFVEPLTQLDPSLSRMREAFKRVQLLGRKPDVKKRPFTRFLRGLQLAYDAPVVGALFGRAVARVAGVPGYVLTELYEESEAKRAATMTYEQLAHEAITAY